MHSSLICKSHVIKKYLTFAKKYEEAEMLYLCVFCSFTVYFVPHLCTEPRTFIVTMFLFTGYNDNLCAKGQFIIYLPFIYIIRDIFRKKKYLRPKDIEKSITVFLKRGDPLQKICKSGQVI